MRASLAVCVVLAALAVPRAAAADRKTAELARGYTKELAACHTRADGVTKVTEGAQRLVDGGATEYRADLDQLHAGQAELAAYCGELEATLQLLAEPAASYKALERQLDDHDNKIRKLRRTSKQALEALAPVIARLIPAINARAGTAAPVVKRTPIKFPSGRAIEAPALPGTWRVSGTATTDTVDYAEGKDSATVSVRLVDGSCVERKHDLPASAVDVDGPHGLAWYAAYDKDARRVRVGCRTAGTERAASLLATLDEPGATGWPELQPVLEAMLAARTEK